MGGITDKAADVYRDSQVAGVPASGPNEPVKSDIRALFSLVEERIGGAAAGLKFYAAKSVLDADTAQPLGTLAYVYDDPTPSNNAVYHYETGGWVIDTAYYEGIAAVVQPEIDSIAAVAASAVESVAAVTPLASAFSPKASDGFFLMDVYGLIGPGITADGQLTSGGEIDEERLPEVKAWRSKAIGMRFRGERARVAIIADSQHRQRYGGSNVPLVQRLRAMYGDGGPGWVPINSDGLNADDDTGAIRGEAQLTVTGAWTALLGQGWSPDQRGAASTQAGATAVLTWTGSGNIANVGLLHNGGVIDYRYGSSGGYTRLDLGARGLAALAAPPAGNWTLTIAVVSGTVQIGGLIAEKATGCVVHNLAASGSAAHEWAGTDQTLWREAIGRLGVGAFVVALGTNDEFHDQTPSQFEAAARTIRESLLVAAPAADVIWSMLPQVPRTAVAERIASYTARLASIASEIDLVLVVLQPRFGESPAQYGNSGSRFIGLQPDNVHVTQIGADIVGDGEAQVLLA